MYESTEVYMKIFVLDVATGGQSIAAAGTAERVSDSTDWGVLFRGLSKRKSTGTALLIIFANSGCARAEQEIVFHR